MLTSKQKYLFDQLGIPHDNENIVRVMHTVRVSEGRAVKNFTRYMEKRVHDLWQRRNRTPYLGD